MKIAVVGAGVTGLSAAWLLGQGHEVTLFEKNARLGGHSNTVNVGDGENSLLIDTGFIVYNTKSYPNLIALFDYLGVETTPTEMSFSVSLHDGRYEYSGNGFWGLFGQHRNLVSPRQWQLARDILRFFSEASAIDPKNHDPSETLGEWLTHRRYSNSFIERHILPMGAAIWSTPAGEMLTFPVAAFARFFANHGLLQVDNRPQWRTVIGGSRSYVEKLRSSFSGRVVSGDPVNAVHRGAGHLTLKTDHGVEETFDHCVLACHADEALALLNDPDEDERKVLGAFRYTKSLAWLHTDERFMPRRRRLWTSWNYMGANGESPMCVSYWMNCLQPLKTSQDYFVTLNPTQSIQQDKVIETINYEHPLFNAKALAAQTRIWDLQGRRNTWFAGSYCGFGFHEDGLQAGLAVAEDLGGLARPWNVDNDRDRLPAQAAIRHTRPVREAAE